ncbi:hypothetical protein HV144_13075 [Citrobacter freundii]|nr:hypothetical protein [Citrobacter freundii]
MLALKIKTPASLSDDISPAAVNDVADIVIFPVPLIVHRAIYCCPDDTLGTQIAIPRRWFLIVCHTQMTICRPVEPNARALLAPVSSMFMLLGINMPARVKDVIAL